MPSVLIICVLGSVGLLAAAMSIARLRATLRSERAASRQAHHLLEEQRQRLELALDGASEALWDWDIAQNRTYYSPRWGEMLGFSAEEVGNSVEIWSHLVHPDDLFDAAQKLTDHMEGRAESYQAAFRMKTRQGGWRWIEARGRVVERDEQGKPARVAGTHLDITEARELTAALAAARDDAMAASRAKSAFLAKMSHEIRTPMDGIVGISQMLMEIAPDEGPVRTYAGIIKNSSEALLTILNDVLDFSKIEAGELVIESESFDLHNVLRQAVDLFHLAASKKGLTLSVQIAPDVPLYVTGDEGRLRQVLVNLVGNAVKFTEQGQVSLRCRRTRGPDAPRLEFSVRDTGIGMSSDTAAGLFRPFRQGEESTFRRYGGSGLGLSISKELVERMRGSLQVTSRVGEGSTFYFSLPLQPAPVCADAPVSDNAARDNPHARILVAEDNVVNQQVIRHLLGHLGHSVEIVSNGRAAVQAFETGGYDIIVMDCQMPEMSGYDAAIRIRERESGHVPIIALTASALSGDRERCLEAGMDDYLTKPVTLSSLAGTLNKWVERRPVAHPADSLAAMARSVGPLNPAIPAETVHEPG